ncbi:nitroreductase family deazaflavin-dependent oxidoreductase, partial [Gordonia sp. (in: high G+C Gram-positive bacteria)]|uniref:nitroreductase family deazaflavin-dependent oxidoreductase n=1 Tax=Gordonia sp. (in: high G+C Gram-positive bacteria) TaxID=84139 RepID=UPI0016B6FD35
MTGIGAKALQTRWFVRSPIPLFRAGLGFLFGGRLLLLEHTGRKSGELRYVALEKVDRPAKDRIIIASGFGEKAQWYRNLQADPRCRVWIGFTRGRPAT